MFQKYLGG